MILKYWAPIIYTNKPMEGYKKREINDAYVLLPWGLQFPEFIL